MRCGNPCPLENALLHSMEISKGWGQPRITSNSILILLFASITSWGGAKEEGSRQVTLANQSGNRLTLEFDS